MFTKFSWLLPRTDRLTRQTAIANMPPSYCRQKYFITFSYNHSSTFASTLSTVASSHLNGSFVHLATTEQLWGTANTYIQIFVDFFPFFFFFSSQALVQKQHFNESVEGVSIQIQSMSAFIFFSGRPAVSSHFTAKRKAKACGTSTNEIQKNCGSFL